MSSVLPRTCIPVPKIEDDCYDWWKRHESKLEWVKKNHADVIFFGDSITHFWTTEDGVNYGEGLWDELFTSKHVLNLGYGFDRIQNVLWRIDHGELGNQDPKLFVICIGTNQYSITPNYDGDTPEVTAQGQKFLLEKLHSLFPNVHLAVMALFPRYGKMTEIQETNKLMHEFIPSIPNAEWIDLWDKMTLADGSQDLSLFRPVPDGCHLRRKGYQVWADAIVPVIRKYAKEALRK